MFEIGGRLHQHHVFFRKPLEETTGKCGGLQVALLHDYVSPVAKVEFQVLELLRKLLTGPWMDQILQQLGQWSQSCWWHCHCEGCHFCVEGLFFKTRRNPDDSYRLFLRKSCTNSRYYIDISAKSRADEELVKKMMTASLVTIVQVLERQYSRYFNLDATALYFRGVRLLQRVLPSAMTVVHYLQSLVKFLQFLANYPHDMYRVSGDGVRDSQRLPLEGAIQRHIGLL